MTRTRYTLKPQPGFHRHTWDITGTQPDGAIRACLTCGERQIKMSNRWAKA